MITYSEIEISIHKTLVLYRTLMDLSFIVIDCVQICVPTSREVCYHLSEHCTFSNLQQRKRIEVIATNPGMFCLQLVMTACNDSTLSLSGLETHRSKDRVIQACLNMLSLNHVDIL